MLCCQKLPSDVSLIYCRILLLLLTLLPFDAITDGDPFELLETRMSGLQSGEGRMIDSDVWHNASARQTHKNRRHSKCRANALRLAAKWAKVLKT